MSRPICSHPLDGLACASWCAGPDEASRTIDRTVAIRALAQRKRAVLNKHHWNHGTPDFELEDVEFLLAELDAMRAHRNHLNQQLNDIYAERFLVDTSALRKATEFG